MISLGDNEGAFLVGWHFKTGGFEMIFYEMGMSAEVLCYSSKTCLNEYIQLPLELIVPRSIARGQRKNFVDSHEIVVNIQLIGKS